MQCCGRALVSAVKQLCHKACSCVPLCTWSALLGAAVLKAAPAAAPPPGRLLCCAHLATPSSSGALPGFQARRGVLALPPFRVSAPRRTLGSVCAS